jgi:tRNA(Ile)-lysidine synthase
MPNALAKSTADRFLDDLKRCCNGQVDARFGLCVSGGPDSIALLLLAHGSNLTCEAATVDHQLRSESKSEASFVAEQCAAMGITHRILTLTGPSTGNVSAWARQERYAALLAWAQERSLDYLLTAHHADDQLETIIMRLNRGSGVAGLAGVRSARDGLARPLLGWRKTELEALVTAQGIVAVDDPSNRNDRYDRARLRKALANADWLDPVAAGRSAAALAEAEDALRWTAKAYENRRVAAQKGVVSFDPRNLPRELQRRIVLSCLHQIDPEVDPRGESLDALIAGLQGDRVATMGAVKCTGGVFWLFEKAPPRGKN